MSNKIIKIDDVDGAVYEIDEWKPAQSTQVKKHFTNNDFLTVTKDIHDFLDQYAK